jgi:hypothetical protein
MKYQDGKPIQSSPCGAWMIELPDGRKFLYLTAPELTLESVVDTFRREHPKFVIGPVWVGEFEIKRIDHYYCADGRRVDQDLNFAPLT